MANIDRIELIEKQHRNQLSDQEKQELDRLYQDPDFDAEVDDMSTLLEGFDALHAEAFSDQLQQWDKKHQQSTTQKPPKLIAMRRFYVYAAAAAVALILTVTFLFNNQEKDLLASHFNADSYTSLAITSESVRATQDVPVQAGQKEKNDAFQAFANEEYAQATKLISAYLEKHQTEDKHARLLLSIAQLEKGEIKEAAQNLTILLENPDPANKATAEWMMALAQVALEDKAAAIKMLNRILAQKGHEYETQANELLEDLN